MNIISKEKYLKKLRKLINPEIEYYLKEDTGNAVVVDHILKHFYSITGLYNNPLSHINKNILSQQEGWKKVTKEYLIQKGYKINVPNIPIHS